jgi:hypothetical protein
VPYLGARAPAGADPDEEDTMSPRAPKKAEETTPTAAGKTTAAKATTTTRKRTVKAAPALPEVSPDEIAMRAYMIHISGEGGDELENWLRAEQELTSAIAA